MGSNSVAFCLSQDLDLQFNVKIGFLEGKRKLPRVSEILRDPTLNLKTSNIYTNSDLLVSCQIYNQLNNRNLTLPVYSPYKVFPANERIWDTWISLPIKIYQLNMNSMLRITLWEYDKNEKIVFAELNTNLFSSDFTLKRGIESIKFSYGDDTNAYSIYNNDTTLNQLNQYYLNEIHKVEWLDKISIPIIENKFHKPDLAEDEFILNIEFPAFELPIVYTDLINYDTISNRLPTLNNYEILNENLTDKSKIKTSLSNDNTWKDIQEDGNENNESLSFSTQKFFDPDQFNSDPIEEKYRHLERSSKRSNLDKQLKPDIKKKNYLFKIINYPPGTQLTAHEKGSIWKYRYSLINNKKALTKLLQSTNLKEEPEISEILELMDLWSEIDIGDAIELLGLNYRNISVRAYAVNRLKKASDKELELYLLQLVQAVCFESVSTFSDKSNSEFMMINSNIGAKSQFQNQTFSNIDKIMNNSSLIISPLAEFLIRRAIKNARLGNFFYWYLTSESKDNPYLKKIIECYCDRLSSDRLRILNTQIKFDNTLREICRDVKQLRNNTLKKQELLRHLLVTKLKNEAMSHEVTLPLDPDIQVCDVFVESSTVFKSSLSPLKISFKTVDGEIYPLMYKVGDDLRQDQLIGQIITLMNELLKSENVDLKLITYKILATGSKEGAIQFIPNDTLTIILSKYHGILPYFQKFYPDPNEKSGVESWVMDNFVKSCAGYCVITYILGVGDRHLENLLITRDGHFFHADFGYILGQDPKPFPPLMKLPPQIIEAFGGTESKNYDKFRSYCFVSYSILRRNAGLILNLFELMKTSNIPDIRIDPDGAVSKLKERFNLDMSDEEATIHFQQLINDSVNALMPIVIDHLHNLAQYWRT